MADYGNNQNRPPVPKTTLDVMSNWMFAEPVNPGGKRPNFRVKFLGNVPRCSVRTNDPNDTKNNGVIDHKTDLQSFFVALGYLGDLAKDLDSQVSFKVEYQDDFVGGQKRDRVMTLSALHVGRDPQSGRIFIAVTAYQRPKIQFFFGPSKYHKIVRGDGSELTPAEVSARYAAAFVTMMTEIVSNLAVSNFDESAKNVPKAPGQQGGGGNRQGGGNRGGGGNYGGNRSGGGGGGNSGGGSSDGGFGGAESFDDWDNG